MTENDYIAEYVRERHPGLLSFDYAVWRVARAIKEAISRISVEDLQRMAEQEDEEDE